jgi:hypothetical protein
MSKINKIRRVSAVAVVSKCAVVNLLEFPVLHIATKLTIGMEITVLAQFVLFLINVLHLLELHDPVDFSIHLLELLGQLFLFLSKVVLQNLVLLAFNHVLQQFV